MSENFHGEGLSNIFVVANTFAVSTLYIDKLWSRLCTGILVGNVWSYLKP